MTEQHCYAALDWDGNCFAVCALPAHHLEDHHTTDTDDHGVTYTVTWKRTPDTVIGQVIE